MRLYHVAEKKDANSIRSEGFKDMRGTDHDVVDGGVQFADRPIYGDKNVFPDMEPSKYVYFIVEVPDDRLRDYELDNEGLDYREFEIPFNEVDNFFKDRTPNDVPADLSMPPDLGA